MMLGKPLGQRFLTPAVLEYAAELEYYEAISKDIAGRYRGAVQAAVDLARRHPAGFKCVVTATGGRAVVVRNFPFRVLYAVEGDDIVVTAIVHTAKPLEPYLNRL